MTTEGSEILFVHCFYILLGELIYLFEDNILFLLVNKYFICVRTGDGPRRPRLGGRALVPRRANYLECAADARS